jgi:single-strand DNA-binding protein
MAGSLNKVMLIGHLGADPEIRRTQDGKPVATFSLATTERWTDKASGVKREQTEWHRIVVFNEQLAETTQKYLKKGAAVFIEGKLGTRKWTDKAGIERWTTEIVLTAFRSTLVMLDRSERAPDAADPGAYGRTSGDAKSSVDDEIPF